MGSLSKETLYSQVRDAALTFALIHESTTEQVVVLRQNAERIYVGRVDGYTFPAAGEALTNYLTVESTGEWSVTSSSAWCTVEQKGGEDKSGGEQPKRGTRSMVDFCIESQCQY